MIKEKDYSQKNFYASKQLIKEMAELKKEHGINWSWVIKKAIQEKIDEINKKKK